jgi:citronellol/citronellal dehydrogenase
MLRGRTVFISGASRGIGLAIGKRLAQEGANVALFAKTATPHPSLPGTVYTAAEEVEAAGGRALPLVGDIRDEKAVDEAVRRTVAEFGGIDILVNNASALGLGSIADLEVKRYDLMMAINTRGTFVTTKACLPYLRASDHAHVLTMSPPVADMVRWLPDAGAECLSKMGMTMLTLSLAAEEPGISANCLWPRTLIRTAAVRNVLGGEAAMVKARSPEIVADAAALIVGRPPGAASGRMFMDDEVLMESGLHDLSRYSEPGASLALDFFVGSWPDGTSPQVPAP